jgi:hypothetical protein
MKDELIKLEKLTISLSKHFTDKTLVTVAVLIQNLHFGCGESERKDLKIISLLKEIKDYLGDQHHVVSWIVDEADFIVSCYYMDEDIQSIN